MTTHSPGVRRHLVVDAPIEEAFRRFTEEIDSWWPPAFTFLGDRLETVSIEPRVGGRWFERAADGEERAWGDVRAWEPPRRLVLGWRVGADRTQEPPERASEVEIRFEQLEEAHTFVEVRHSGFERHGEGAEALRTGMAGKDGWQGLLETFAAPYRTGGAPSDEALT